MLVPCALGGVLRPGTVPELRCRWVVGSANNQLSDDAVADLLAERGIGYVPDFIANAGGLMAVAEQLNGWDPDRVAARVDGIGPLVAELIAEARARGETTLRAARRRAGARLLAAA